MKLTFGLAGEKSGGLLLAALAAVWLLNLAFIRLNLDWGVTRSLLLAAQGVTIVALGAPTRVWRIGPRVKNLIKLGLLAAFAIWIGVAIVAEVKVARTGAFPLDVAQASWRAGRLLTLGRNPYGFEELVDFGVFLDRAPTREAAGLTPPPPHPELDRALAAFHDKRAEGPDKALAFYDQDLDLALRARLMRPARADSPGPLEVRLLGVKYGPLAPLMNVPFAWLKFPGGVVILNTIAAFLLLGAYYVLLRRNLHDEALARLGLLAVMIDANCLNQFIRLGANDTYPLLLGVLAVLACQSGRQGWGAAALGVGFAFKTFPAALFLPLLLQGGRVKPLLIFAAVAGAIYLPFAVADPAGLFDNVFLWPTLRNSDTTSWLYYAPPLVGKIAKGLAALCLIGVWSLYFLKRSPTLFQTLALTTLLALLSSQAFHNDYAPWAVIWVIAALIEHFAPQPQTQTPDMTDALATR